MNNGACITITQDESTPTVNTNESSKSTTIGVIIGVIAAFVVVVVVLIVGIIVVVMIISHHKSIKSLSTANNNNKNIAMDSTAVPVYSFGTINTQSIAPEYSLGSGAQEPSPSSLTTTEPFYSTE